MLVDFHRQAATGPGVDVHGEPDAVRRLVLGNLAECPRDLDPRLIDLLGARLAELLASLAPVLGERLTEGRIRDGHGDLHAGNVCFLADRVIGYDCIEFDPALRCGDVACDLAFLVMDLHARGFPAFGNYLAHRYGIESGDPTLGKVLPLYLTHRALVRSKVAWLRASAADAPAPHDPARLESARYLALAAGFLAPRALLVVCGLPGTGKSTIAAALEHAVDGVVLSSDRIRKRLVGLEPTEHWHGDPDGGPYAPEWTRRTYDEMHDQASHHLAAGRSVILDATFPVAEWRARFIRLAALHGVQARVLAVEAPQEVVEERLRARAFDPRAVSDAGIEVYRRARGRFEHPGAAELAPVVALDARRPADDASLAVLASLLEGTSSSVGGEPATHP
ncbi:MAG: AAA family ATPase [Deltaproteobacteria bacterium]|nr:AAA family ATPase [Deltaproteobacteria bacterium]